MAALVRHALQKGQALHGQLWSFFDSARASVRAALSRSDQQRRCYSATYNTLNVCRHLTTARTHRILRNQALPRMDERGQRRSLMSQIEPLLGRELST